NAEESQAEAIASRRQFALVSRPFAAREVSLDLLLRRVPSTRLLQVFLHLLVDGGVHEESEDDGRGAVNRHRNRRRRRTKIETGIKLLHVVHGRDRDT